MLPSLQESPETLTPEMMRQYMREAFERIERLETELLTKGGED